MPIERSHLHEYGPATLIGLFPVLGVIFLDWNAGLVIAYYLLDLSVIGIFLIVVSFDADHVFPGSESEHDLSFLQRLIVNSIVGLARSGVYVMWVAGYFMIWFFLMGLASIVWTEAPDVDEHASMIEFAAELADPLALTGVLVMVFRHFSDYRDIRQDYRGEGAKPALHLIETVPIKMIIYAGFGLATVWLTLMFSLPPVFVLVVVVLFVIYEPRPLQRKD